MFRLSLPSFAIFLGSVIVGALLAFAVRKYRLLFDVLYVQPELPHSLTYLNWLHSLNVTFEPMTGDGMETMMTEAAFLKRKVRLLCFVMPKHYDSPSLLKYFGTHSRSALGFDTASAIMKTWGRRCNKMVFFGHSPRVRPAGVSVLSIKSPSVDSWSALREAMIQIAINFQEQYDWFLKVELETYVVIENLRYYLAVFDSTWPHYFGHAYNSWGVKYNAQEAGFVLSSGALRKLHNALIKGLCEPSARLGEVELGRCLSDIGIKPSDTRDSRQRGRFLMLDPEDLLVPASSSWKNSFWEKSIYHIREGPECCSDFAVTFHAQPNSIYILEYLIYHLKPFGTSTPLSDVQSMQ